MVERGMAWSKFAVPVVAMSLMAAPAAQARQNPEPPPSGIVVHLFGPGSVTSNILPSAESVLAPPGAGEPAASPAGAAPAYVEPTAGEVLHQMFVTGDPNKPATAKLPKGRPGEQD